MGHSSDYAQKKYEEARAKLAEYNRYGSDDWRKVDCQKIIVEFEIGHKVILRLKGGNGYGKRKRSQVPFFPRTIRDVRRMHHIDGGGRSYNAGTKAFMLRHANKVIRQNDKRIIREVEREYEYSSRNDFVKRFVNIDAIG